jgi:5-methylcytosine-specific restriction endonuclease McrA
MQPLTPRQKVIGGAILVAGLLMMERSRNDDDEDLDDVEWAHRRTCGRCFYCGKQIPLDNYGVAGARGWWEIDHFIPFSRGGSDQPYNWVAACVDCNTSKSDLMPWDFQPERFAVRDRDPDNYF